MKKTPKFLLIPVIVVFLVLAVRLWFSWEMPLMDVLPQEAWREVQARGEEWEILDEELIPFLTALRQAKVSRDDTPSQGLSAPYMEFHIHCDLHDQPTLLYIQSNGDIAFAVHMDTDHYKHFEGSRELYQTLLEIGIPEKR